MAETRPDIVLLAGVQTDVYAALNAQGGFPAVTIGALLSVQNKGNSPTYLTTKATIPIASDGSAKVAPGDRFNNEATSPGEWALSIAANGLINVRVI